MNIAQAITHLFPQANPMQDFIVQDDSDGNGAYIAQWNVKDAQGKDIPKPTSTDIQKAWDAMQPKDADILAKAQQAKIAELTAARDAQLLAGFSSNATGAVLDFGFDVIDQDYLKEKCLLMTIDTTVTSIPWKTKKGFVTLTRDQFFQVVKDAGAFKELLVRELMQLEANALNCTTVDAVNLIHW